jgi:spore maturation protein CgeB
MKFVVFGLSISSSWGNGHATLWRGLCSALARAGHKVVFFERDVPYYSAHRDYTEIPNGKLILYNEPEEISDRAKRELARADVAMVTSYCPDAGLASRFVLDSDAQLRVFYDLDAPVTLSRLKAGLPVDYIGPDGLGDFDLVLSYTGGLAIEGLKQVLGARRVAPLYGSVDPETHYPTSPKECFRGDLSYLGTWSADREAALQALFLDPAEMLPQARFVIGGSQYGSDFHCRENIRYCNHVPSADHPAFYCSSPLTLNVTREPMAAMGYCPSARLFEATACGAVLLTDKWEGLDYFFQPDSEVLVVRTPRDVLREMQRSPAELRRIAEAARAHTLTRHTARHRAQELIVVCDAVASRHFPQMGVA